jgi:hypothetical protein
VNDLGEYDDGSDPFMKNYTTMLQEMNHPEGDEWKTEEKEHVKDIMSTLDTPNFRDHVPNNEMMNEFLNMRLSVDWQEEFAKFEGEKEFIVEHEREGSTYSGRLSPIAKEKIYRLYLKGATSKALSSRFGILPDRVKAIVF